jgi:hypothetical protein
VVREHAADDVLVDIDAKGTRNLLCDAGTTNTGIAALELDDRVDVLGFRMTASLGIRLAGTNSDPRPKTKRSNEFRFGARRNERLLMSNWCFINKDSATTTRTPPGRTSLAMVASRWTASMSR